MRCPDPPPEVPRRQTAEKVTARSFATVLAGLVIAGAGAAPASALSDHDAAMQFSFAAYRARIALVADKPEIQRRVDALSNDDRCLSAIRRAPRRARPRLGRLLGLGLVDALIVPLRPALDTLRTDLGEIVTTDRALRSGRAAWRFIIRTYDTLPDLGDVCGLMAAWQRTGFDPKRAPATHLKQLERLAGHRVRPIQRKLDAAARRMEQLGVPRRDAHRFTGDPLLRGLEPDLTETSTGSGSSGPPPV